MGCIVIASNQGGMAEMIEDGKSGFLVEPRRPEQIAEILLRNYKDPVRLEEVSAAAHRRSHELADAEKTRDRILANYTLSQGRLSWAGASTRRVSVIIPYYNQGRYLPEAVASVRSSTYRNTEIVIVDDGSSDPASNAQFEQIEGVVKIRKANGGLSSARNAGIRAAKGDYVLMLDADDLIHPDYITAGVAALENNPDLGYVTCHARNFGALDNAYIPVGFVPALMLALNTDGKCANLYRRKVFEDCGGYDEVLVSYEDWDFLLTLNELGWKGDVLPAEFFFYRRHFDSMVYTVADPRRAELIQYMMLKHYRLLEKHSPLLSIVLARLWKEAEVAAEKVSAQPAHISSKEMKRVLKKYLQRKLGWSRRSIPAFPSAPPRDVSRLQQGRAGRAPT